MQKLTIVGGGTAGWLTAAILAKGLPCEQFQIILMESPDIPTVGVGEATIPPITNIIKYLELDEAQLLKKIEGTYKYGIQFENWATQNSNYMHAFGALGTPYQGIDFSEMWLNYASALDLTDLSDFIPSAVASKQNRFYPAVDAPVTDNPNAFFPLTKLFYAYQFDASLFAKELAEYAVNLGVEHIKASVEQVRVTARGNIGSVSILAGGELKDIDADYFIDCTGAKGLLIKQTLNSEFDDWKAYLPCDRAVAVQTQSTGEIPPYTRSIAMDSGWRWQIPLRHRTGNGYVYSSDFCDDETALKMLTDSLEEEMITEPKFLAFQTGCVKQPWLKNCVAIGLSSGFLEPLESTSIHLIYKYALKFKEALLHGQYMYEEAKTFNKAYHDDALEIRDFLVAHYHITQRDDSAFWRHCQQMDIPESLKLKLTEFKQTGKLTLPYDCLFGYGSWLQVLVGQACLSSYSHLAKMVEVNHQTVELEQAKLFFENVKFAIAQEIKRIPLHQDFLNR